MSDSRADLRWLSVGPDGVRTKDPLGWAAFLGVYAVINAVLSARNVPTSSDAGATGAATVASGLGGIAIVCGISTLVCLRAALGGPMSVPGLGLLGRWLRGSCVCMLVIMGIGVAAELAPVTSSSSPLDNALLITVAGLMPAFLLGAFARLCARAHRALST